MYKAPPPFFSFERDRERVVYLAVFDVCFWIAKVMMIEWVKDIVLKLNHGIVEVVMVKSWSSWIGDEDEAWFSNGACRSFPTFFFFFFFSFSFGVCRRTTRCCLKGYQCIERCWWPWNLLWQYCIWKKKWTKKVERRKERKKEVMMRILRLYTFLFWPWRTWRTVWWSWDVYMIEWYIWWWSRFEAWSPQEPVKRVSQVKFF